MVRFFVFVGCIALASCLQLGMDERVREEIMHERDGATHWGKALIVLTNKDSYLAKTGVGNSLLDVTIGYEKLKARGYKVEFASLGGGDAPFDLGAFEDFKSTNYKDNCSSFLNAETNDGSTIADTLKLEDLDHLKYHAIYLPGGLPAVSEFTTSMTLKTVIKEMYDACKLVVTVSTGGLALRNVTLSNGSYLAAGLPVSAATNSELKDLGVYGSVKTNPCTPEDWLTSNGAIFHEGYAVANNLGTAQNYTSLDGLFDAIDKAKHGAKFKNNCPSMGSASGGTVKVNFNESKITQSNLGGHGPDDGIETLGYKNVYTTEDGTMVNMRIVSDDYSSSHSEENGLAGNITMFGNVNIEQGKEVPLQFGFWTAPPNSVPVRLDSFYLTFYDLTTHTKDQTGTLSVSTRDHSAYFLAYDTTVSTKGSTGDQAVLTGTEEGVEPWLASTLLPEEKRQAVTFLFEDKSALDINVTVSGGSGNRNVRFSGRSIFHYDRCNHTKSERCQSNHR